MSHFVIFLVSPSPQPTDVLLEWPLKDTIIIDIIDIDIDGIDVIFQIKILIQLEEDLDLPSKKCHFEYLVSRYTKSLKIMSNKPYNFEDV